MKKTQTIRVSVETSGGGQKAVAKYEKFVGVGYDSWKGEEVAIAEALQDLATKILAASRS